LFQDTSKRGALVTRRPTVKKKMAVVAPVDRQDSLAAGPVKRLNRRGLSTTSTTRTSRGSDIALRVADRNGFPARYGHELASARYSSPLSRSLQELPCPAGLTADTGSGLQRDTFELT
jgi:hypothetical protein